jgi:hypothetical protein
MKLSSSTSSSNLSFLVALAVGLAALFAADHWLYAECGFLRLFGPGTQEGQVLGKLDAAPNAAAVADIILFGSSLTRSGVSTQPFRDHGLVSFNLAVSGGGPLFAYEALKRIEPVVAKRRTPPVLVLEISPLALLAEAKWDEFPQWVSAVRGRLDVAENYYSYYEHFRKYGLASRLFNSFVLPSSYYRSFRRHVALGGRYDAGFYGDEDIGGFAPISTSNPAGKIAEEIQVHNPPLSAHSAEKLKYVERFLTLAQDVRAPVLLYFYPLLYSSPERGAALFAYLSSRFPASRLEMMTNSDIGIDMSDVQFGGWHLNSRGSEKVARALIRKLGLEGSNSAAERWDWIAAELPISVQQNGAICAKFSRLGRHGIELKFDGAGAREETWLSEAISVVPGVRYTLDGSFDLREGKIHAGLESVDELGNVKGSNGAIWPTPTPGALTAGVQSLSLTAATDRLRLRLVQPNGGVKGQVRFWRLWARQTGAGLVPR